MQKICTLNIIVKCVTINAVESFYGNNTYPHVNTNRQRRQRIGNRKICKIIPSMFVSFVGENINKDQVYGGTKRNVQPAKESVVVANAEHLVVTESGDDEMKMLVKEMMSHMRTQSEQIQAQNKIISDMIPKMGSNNNNRFNINVFLNEQCKDALDMSDFLESLQIQLRDLDYIRDNGLLEGISTVFIKGLEQLDTFKRPIHCTDVKRETLYIKDGGEWDRDTGKERLKTAIDTVANKHRIALAEWERKNPNWQKSESKKEEYIY